MPWIAGQWIRRPCESKKSWSQVSAAAAAAAEELEEAEKEVGDAEVAERVTLRSLPPARLLRIRKIGDALPSSVVSPASTCGCKSAAAAPAGSV